MTIVAVTGASGFVGSHLIPALLAAGHEVRGLSRKADTRGEAGDGVTWIEGDVRNREIVRQLVDGAEWVVHLAAPRADHEAIEDVLVRGTETVLAVSHEAKRLVTLSCMGADASSPSTFYRSRWAADSLVKSSAVPHVILQASLILGPGDGVIAPLASLIRSWPAVPVPGRGQARMQPIDVGDVVSCVLESLRRDDVPDEMIGVGGPMFVTPRQLVDLVGREVGAARPKVLVPDVAVPLTARCLPPAVRDLFVGPRADRFRNGAVMSPGIVPRHFGFVPANVTEKLGQYLG